MNSFAFAACLLNGVWPEAAAAVGAEAVAPDCAAGGVCENAVGMTAENTEINMSFFIVQPFYEVS
jgi:F0F1-type ATP synthase membrane subunit c/vacuolar-type H+-ATPase subunit K